MLDDAADAFSSESELLLGTEDSTVSDRRGGLDATVFDRPGGLELCPDLEQCDQLTQDGWRPGWDSGPWLRSWRSWPAMVMVVVANVSLSLQRLPSEILAVMNAAMHHTFQHTSPILRAASGLLHLGPSSIWRAVQALKNKCWRPLGSESDSQLVLEADGDSDRDEVAILQRLTRVVLGVQCSHGGEVEYQRWLCRLIGFMLITACGRSHPFAGPPLHGLWPITALGWPGSRHEFDHYLTIISPLSTLS